jgi:dCMP deaminase
MNKMDAVYMGMAELMASISHGVNLKVGCALVTNNGVVLTGVNGQAKQLGNVLEYRDYEYQGREQPYTDEDGCMYRLTTKPSTIHAELNAILKAAKEGVSVVGSTVYLTHSPCVSCASMLVQAGVIKVVYKAPYRCADGIVLLIDCDVEVVKYESQV